MGALKACLTFIFDDPKKIAELSVTDVNVAIGVFDDEVSAQSFENYLDNYFSPVCESLINSNIPAQLCISSGFLTDLSKYKNLFANFIQLIRNEQIELILQGTSISFLYSMDLWEQEIKRDLQVFKNLLKEKPKGYRTPGNVYFNEISKVLSKLGFKYTFAGAIDWYLGHNYSERIFKSKTSGFKLCLVDTEQHHSNFNFSEQKICFLQIDEEIFEHHQNSETLIEWIYSMLDLNNISKAIRNPKNNVYDIKQPISGSIHNHQLSSFKGNSLQTSAIQMYYEIGQKILIKHNKDLLTTWMELGHADYFLKMNDKDAARFYNNYMLVLASLELRLH